jgi:glycosyltransferase involved in cell wall biosynthesis
MKIALVCPASLPATQFGGILFLAVDIAKELSENKNDVTIFTTNLDFANNAHTFNKKLLDEEKVDNFKINRSHVWFNYKLFYVNPKMYFRIKDSKPDIIHTIGLRSFQSFLAALVSKYHKIPLVISDQSGLTTHPDLTTSGFLQKFLYRLQMPIINFIIKQSSKIIVPNEYEKNIFLKFIDESKIEIIRNGIDLKQFDLEKIDFRKKYQLNDPFILFLGRFSKIKGIDILIESIKILKNQSKIKNVKFVLMGSDFGFEKQMNEMIQSYDLVDNIHIIKNPQRSEIFGAFEECLFLVLPSRWELSPLTPLEGFAFKKTVLSTTSHGIPYTLRNNVDSILVEPNNPQNIANGILELLNNSEKRKILESEGFNLVKNECNSKMMSIKIFDVYKKLVKNRF